MTGRFGLKTGAVVATAALIAAGASATASYAAEQPSSSSRDYSALAASDYEDGRYIVVLDEQPAASYEGGEAGLAATKPAEGARLDANSSEVVEYTSYLADRQEAVAADAGVTPDHNITVTLNAFTAKLTAAQAQKLAGKDGVAAVVRDEIRHPTAVPSTEFLGLSGPGGVWEKIGGPNSAGEGVVVGVIDTGIAPENPSFAGSPLGTTPGDEPYLEGNTVVFNKADGGQFRADRVAGEQWNNDDYSTKLIGAQFFLQGATASGFDFQYDHKSPRDGDGHGSHTASTAAGNNDVAATLNGVDMGKISGVAPGAKIAAYKACYAGPDVLVTTDDICAGSDLLAAIDKAVKDGVDVINYSIGGGAATSVLALEDESFFNAAAAGIFVAVSAGNDGPDESTADHASPWYTTVAASTIPTYEGTVTLPNGFEAAGASVSVGQGKTLTGPVVYAGDIAKAGAKTSDAALCVLGSLDAAKALGKIVVCDRGGNARVEKSLEVKNAGGIGSILVNVTPGSLDNDLHSVPTVHIPHTFRTALLDYVRNTPNAEATLLGDNITGVTTPTPQIAGFSSRGPMLADGSDILKPDVTAPGVNILAAEHNKEGEAPIWGLKSGTSMSSPHVAGLGALYLGERPNATPAEVKSALMTTAYNSVNADGSDNTDPYEQGAGHVDPTKFFEPGLLYLNGPDDWKAFLAGKGLGNYDVTPIDGSDLNLASIAIGRLAGTQTVTRTVTAQTAGTYTATIDVPGISAELSTTSITLAAGESKTFTVTFQNDSAPLEEWATGFLTWTNGTIEVRSPIAVYPTVADAPLELSGVGVNGTIDYSFVAGTDGTVPLTLTGLAEYEVQPDPDGIVEGHSGNEKSGDADRDQYFEITVPEGAAVAAFDLTTSDPTSDLDLYLYRFDSPDDAQPAETFTIATGSAGESKLFIHPTPGLYVARVNLFSTPNPQTWDLTTAITAPNQAGGFAAVTNPVPASASQPSDVTLKWTGLEYDKKYVGYVAYGDVKDGTLVKVSAGSQPALATGSAPVTITGSGVVGEPLKVDLGTWNEEGLAFDVQWLVDGVPVAGTGGGGAGARTLAVRAEAPTTTFTPTEAQIGKSVTARVTATSPATGNTGTAVSAGVTVTAVPATSEPATSEPATPTKPGGGGNTALPVTGAGDAMLPLGIGVLVLALGAGAFLYGRRRRSEV